MKDLAKIVMDAPSMTSVEIADLMNVTHEEVVKVIKEISGEGAIHPSHELNGIYGFEGEQGRLDCIVVMTRFEPKLIAAIIDRMDYLKREIAKAEKKRQSINIYHRLEDAIREENNLASIEDIKAETDLIHKIVFGVTESEYRKKKGVAPDAPISNLMTKTELKAVDYLQTINKYSYRNGFGFESRKTELQTIFDRKFKERLTEETLRLEA